MPNLEIPVMARTYKDPENSIIPEIHNQPDQISSVSGDFSKIL